MKKFILGLALLITVGLAACSNNTHANKASSSSEVSTSKQSSVTSSKSLQQTNKTSNSGNEESSSNVTSVDDKTLGVLVSLLELPNWFKDSLASGTLSYGTNSDYSNEVHGYSFITANGDPSSYIYYKLNGDQVTIKEWITEGDEAEYQGHFKTTTVSLERLENDYYVTPAQKNEVQGYVNQLKN